MQSRACILISCEDRPGIVAAVSAHLLRHDANIVQLDQYSTDPDEGTYFMRVEFDYPSHLADRLQAGFEEVAQRFAMSWRFAREDTRKRMAIFVTKEDHCLLELLWQWKRGDLKVEIPMVISNHSQLEEAAAPFGVPFYHLPIEDGNKAEQEKRALSLMDGKVDFVVLARYMQVLSPRFLSLYTNQVINIHHSFLPAFVGGKPYHQAYDRGVKIIGATAHYASEDLDQGPIIEQDIARVDHRDSVADLQRIGRDIERRVLARAVKWHIEERILVFGNKTIVFG